MALNISGLIVLKLRLVAPVLSCSISFFFLYDTRQNSPGPTGHYTLIMAGGFPGDAKNLYWDLLQR